MKYINYDAEGDILSLTFSEAETHTGIELSDNIVFYYNPETKEALGLVLLSYRALLKASAYRPLPLDRLARAPKDAQRVVISLLQRAPVTNFLQLVEMRDNKFPASRLSQVFSPSALQAVA